MTLSFAIFSCKPCKGRYEISRYTVPTIIRQSRFCDRFLLCSASMVLDALRHLPLSQWLLSIQVCFY